MRLAFVTTLASSPWGGSELLWAETAACALAAGHDVCVHLPRWPETPAKVAGLSAAGARLYRRRRALRCTLEWLLPQAVVPLTYGGLKRRRPDVICISQGSAYDAVLGGFWYAVERYATDRGVPYVLLSQSGGDRVQASLTDRHRSRARRLFRQAAAPAFLSRLEIETIEWQLAVHLPHAIVVRNPVNLRRKEPLPWPEPTGVIRMASVARLHTGDKGQDLLLQVLSQPPWDKRNWQLTLFGEGPAERYLKDLVAFYGLTDRVRLAGFEPSVEAIWADHHLLVMPSRSEGVPLAMVEAMLCGRPVVCTDVGGVREWIEDGQNGFLAEAPTAYSLRRALERAWQTHPGWPAMGTRAAENALPRMDPEPGRTLLSLIEGAIRS